MPGRTNVDIKPAIAVYIYEYNTRIPFVILYYPGLVTDIIKFKIAFIEIQFINPCIRGKKNIGKSIVINITNSYSTTVIKVSKKKTVIKPAIFYIILKAYSCVFL